jgi:hypothetical protein
MVELKRAFAHGALRIVTDSTQGSWKKAASAVMRGALTEQFVLAREAMKQGAATQPGSSERAGDAERLDRRRAEGFSPGIDATQPKRKRGSFWPTARTVGAVAIRVADTSRQRTKEMT